MSEQNIIELATVPATMTVWDSDRMSKLHKEMSVHKKVVLKEVAVVKIPDDVIIQAMGEVLSKIGWTMYKSIFSMVKIQIPYIIVMPIKLHFLLFYILPILVH